jgi:hypothetical protein
MAICEFCNKEMRLASSCKQGDPDQMPFGSERKAELDEHLPDPLKTMLSHDPERCPDCKVEIGGYHHPGCDGEECPQCHGQLISCKCDSGPTLVVIDGGKGD